MTSASERSDYLAVHGADLIDNGFTIVPIPPGTKGPKEEGWQDIRSTKLQLEKWLDNGSRNYGVGILTKNTPAVDIDVLDEAIATSMVEWVQENIGDGLQRIGNAPKTMLIFRTDKPFRKVTSARFIDPQNPTKANGKPNEQRLEVLADGQQFVAYHIHPDTKEPYYWPNPHQNPLEVTELELPPITEGLAKLACEEFERLCTAAGWKRAGRSSTQSERHTDEDADFTDAPSEDKLAEIPPPPENELEVARVRQALEAIDPSLLDYEEWFKVMASLKWTQWTCSEALALTWSERSDKHGEEHFERTWHGLGKRSRRKEFTLGTVFFIAKDQFNWVDTLRNEIAIEEERDAFEKIMEEVDFLSPTRTADQKLFKMIVDASLSHTSLDRVLTAIYAATKVKVLVLKKELHTAAKPDLNGELPTHAGYAAMLLKVLKSSTGIEPVGVGGMIYTFSKEKGVWIGRFTGEYAMQVAEHFDGQDKCERRTDYVSIASCMYELCADEDFFREAPVGMAASNGKFYRIFKDDEEKPVKPEPLNHRHRQRMLSTYAPVKGEFPLFIKFMNETFAGDEGGGYGGQQYNAIMEIWAATLLRFFFKYEKVALLKGLGRSGKGSLLKMMGASMPHDMVCAVSPFKFNNEYYLASLANRAMNIVGELPEDIPLPAAEFKTVIGRDLLTGRHPSHKPFTFTNTATHILNSNYFPYVKDHSDALHSRFILFEFKNSRLDIEDDEDGADSINIDLANEIIEGEMPAIMAELLQFAIKLLKRGKLKTTSAHRRLEAQWRHRTSTLMEFLLDADECKLTTQKGYTKRRDFYEAYSMWCRSSNRKPMGKQKLYDDIDSKVVRKMGVFMGKITDNHDVVRGVVLANELNAHLIWRDAEEEEL